MNWEIFKNIVLIILVFTLLFILSDDPKFNYYIKKRKINIFILLILIYFIYADFPLILIVLGLLLFIGMNPSFYKKYILDNKILKKYNVQEYFENKDSYDIKPYMNDNLLSMESIEKDTDEKTNEKTNENNNIDENKISNNKENEIDEKNEKEEDKMPFKKQVQDLREQFETIIGGFKTSD